MHFKIDATSGNIWDPKESGIHFETFNSSAHLQCIYLAFTISISSPFSPYFWRKVTDSMLVLSGAEISVNICLLSTDCSSYKLFVTKKKFYVCFYYFCRAFWLISPKRFGQKNSPIPLTWTLRISSVSF